MASINRGIIACLATAQGVKLLMVSAKISNVDSPGRYILFTPKIALTQILGYRKFYNTQCRECFQGYIYIFIRRYSKRNVKHRDISKIKKRKKKKNERINI